MIVEVSVFHSEVHKEANGGVMNDRVKSYSLTRSRAGH